MFFRGEKRAEAVDETSPLSRFPEEFNEGVYREHTDLQHMKSQDLFSHWLNHGITESRQSHVVSSRQDLLDCLKGYTSVLEIGPYDRPLSEYLRGKVSEIKYADYLSTEEMIKRAQTDPERTPSNVPQIDYVVKAGLSETIKRKFQGIISCHCVEHHADLIQHFKDINSLLEDGGAYLFFIPDKDKCFDHFLSVSEIPEVVTAHLEQRKKPTLRSVIEHRVYTRFDFDKCQENPLIQQSVGARATIDAAFDEFKSRPYCDVHCWYFTNSSLKNLLKSCIDLDFLPKTTQFRTYQLGGEIGVVITF